MIGWEPFHETIFSSLLPSRWSPASQKVFHGMVERPSESTSLSAYTLGSSVPWIKMDGGHMVNIDIDIYKDELLLTLRTSRLLI